MLFLNIEIMLLMRKDKLYFCLELIDWLVRN